MLRSDEEEAGTLVMDLTADKDESINKDIECVTPRTGSVLEQKDGAEEFVEGGFRGWLNVLGAFLTTFISFGFSNGWAILQNYYAKSKYPDRTPSEIAWIGSSQIFFMFVMGSVSGPLYDKVSDAWSYKTLIPVSCPLARCQRVRPPIPRVVTPS